MFEPLSQTDIREILRMQMHDLQEKLSENGVTVEFTEGFEDYMSTKGYEPQYGARPIKRLMQKELINLLAKSILDGHVRRDSVILVDVVDGQITSLKMLIPTLLPQRISPLSLVLLILSIIRISSRSSRALPSSLSSTRTALPAMIYTLPLLTTAQTMTSASSVTLPVPRPTFTMLSQFTRQATLLILKDSFTGTTESTPI